MKKAIFPVLTENERKLPFYLVGLGCMYTQEHVVRPNGYPNYQWIQCHEGEGEIIIGERTHRVKPGQGMFLYPNEPHEYYAIKEPWQVDWLDFNGYQVEQFLETIGIKHTEVLYVANSEIILSKMRKADGILRSDSLLKGTDCSVIVYEVLMDLLKYASRSNDESVEQQHQRLQPVFDYIEKNYHKTITLEEMAAIIGVTPEHFCILFKKIMKIRPFEYLNHVRINKSKDMIIKNERMAIRDVARWVGYDNASYFCAVFKKMEGMSPGNFKKLHRYNI